MKDLIVLLIIICIILTILFYLNKSKKQGKNCIGCPYAKQCSKKQNNTNCCNN